MKDNLKDTNPSGNFCVSHTLINSEKQATLVANYYEDFRKKFQKVIQYPGKEWELARDVFDENIVDGGGVRLFVKYEQYFQISTHGPKKSLRDF